MSPQDATVASPDTITLEKFKAALEMHPGLIEAIANNSPDSQKKNLVTLSAFRYTEAPALFSDDKEYDLVDKPKRAMIIDDVKHLVEWKLRHGKFRPTLMKLVSENDADFVKKTVLSAKEKYAGDSKNTKAALDILTKLRGIGPATASLLLSVQDPAHVIFFSDEAFYWLCGGGKEVSIKYNAKEYVALREAAEKLRERLGVSAIDIEKVADVMMKIGSSVPDKPEHPAESQPFVTDSMPKVEPKKAKKANDSTKPAGKAKTTAASKKRKSETPVQEGDAAGDHGGLRRSKRNKV